MADTVFTVKTEVQTQKKIQDNLMQIGQYAAMSTSFAQDKSSKIPAKKDVKKKEVKDTETREDKSETDSQTGKAKGQVKAAKVS
jgi:hypothetical protein